MLTKPTADVGLYNYSQRDARVPQPSGPTMEVADVGLRIVTCRTQQRLRQLEKRAADLFLQNLVKSTSHLSLGIEAAAEVEAATEFARASPPPGEHVLLTEVWGDGGSVWRK